MLSPFKLILLFVIGCEVTLPIRAGDRRFYTVTGVRHAYAQTKAEGERRAGEALLVQTTTETTKPERDDGVIVVAAPAPLRALYAAPRVLLDQTCVGACFRPPNA